MEFPPEIIRIIREYSAPRFLYYKEYNHALRVHRRKTWPELKFGLYRNPERVLEALSKVEQCQNLFLTNLSNFNDGINDLAMLDKRGKLHRANQNLMSILLE
jgi:hypothetical protein